MGVGRGVPGGAPGDARAKFLEDLADACRRRAEIRRAALDGSRHRGGDEDEGPETSEGLPYLMTEVWHEFLDAGPWRDYRVLAAQPCDWVYLKFEMYKVQRHWGELPGQGRGGPW